MQARTNAHTSLAMRHRPSPASAETCFEKNLLGGPCNRWHTHENVDYPQTLISLVLYDMQPAAMAEWLRRWTWNPMGSSRAGSNPARSVFFFFFFFFFWFFVCFFVLFLLLFFSTFLFARFISDLLLSPSSSSKKSVSKWIYDRSLVLFLPCTFPLSLSLPLPSPRLTPFQHLTLILPKYCMSQWCDSKSLIRQCIFTSHFLWCVCRNGQRWNKPQQKGQNSTTMQREGLGHRNWLDTSPNESNPRWIR